MRQNPGPLATPMTRAVRSIMPVNMPRIYRRDFRARHADVQFIYDINVGTSVDRSSESCSIVNAYVCESPTIVSLKIVLSELSFAASATSALLLLFAFTSA